MSYDSYRRAEPGQRRCSAMSGGDRCEYREHRGKAHAARTGSHLWVEAPLGVCSACETPQYPLGVVALPSSGRFACGDCALPLTRHVSMQWVCPDHGLRSGPDEIKTEMFATRCCDDGVVVRSPHSPFSDDDIDSRAEWREDAYHANRPRIDPLDPATEWSTR